MIVSKNPYIIPLESGVTWKRYQRMAVASIKKCCRTEKESLHLLRITNSRLKPKSGVWV